MMMMMMIEVLATYAGVYFQHTCKHDVDYFMIFYRFIRTRKLLQQLLQFTR